MARVAAQLTNFTGGEFSPRLDGRNDIAKYTTACKTLENFVVYPHGSATRRPGTTFISEVKDSSKKTRLIPFEFSTTQTYMLEFGNQYIRIYKDKGQVLDSGSAVEVSTPYLEAELFDLKFAQSADVMYITHPNHEVEKLSRTSHTAWTLSDVDFTDGPYLDNNITTTTLNPGSHTVGTGVAVVASATTGINGGSGFLATDVGRLIRFRDGYMKVTARADTTNITVEIIEDLGSATASVDFALGAFSDTTGHPTCVTFFEQRLVFAGTTDQPQTVFFSKSGDYENMNENRGGTIADDDAIIYTIASNQVNAIRFMTATRTLIIGTAGGEFVVSGGGTDVAVTPTNILIKKQSNHGAANVDAIAVGNATLFLQRAKRKIRELAYNFDVDGYIAPDMTILAEHVTEGGLTQMAYQQEPNQIVYATRNDGELIALTYQREQKVTAWHRHIFGGRFGNATITVTDYANIANGTRIVLTKADGTQVTFTSSTTDVSGKFHTETSNNQTATNLKTLIDADSNFTATVSSNVVTITETTPISIGFLTITSLDDATRLAKTDEGKAVCESVAVIPTDDTEYEVYVIVKRTINGATKRYVEVLNTFDFDETDNTSFNFLDSQLTYSGSAATSISGLSHLEGQTVSILTNGATHPDKTVSSGAVTLDRSATEVKIGLAYTSLLTTMRLDAGSQNGTSQGKTKRIYDITIRMFETVGIEVGPDLNNMERIPFRSSANDMDNALPVFTGDKEVEFRGNYETDGFVFVRQTQPLPLTLLSLYPRLQTNDG
nr:putative tail tubular protein B [uncultured Mediterranean phage uvMED]